MIHVRDASMAGRLAEVFDRAWAEAVPLSAVVDDESGAFDGDAIGTDPIDGAPDLDD